MNRNPNDTSETERYIMNSLYGAVLVGAVAAIVSPEGKRMHAANMWGFLGFGLGFAGTYLLKHDAAAERHAGYVPPHAVPPHAVVPPSHAPIHPMQSTATSPSIQATRYDAAMNLLQVLAAQEAGQVAPSAVVPVLRTFQSTSNLPVTGNMDSQTLSALSQAIHGHHA